MEDDLSGRLLVATPLLGDPNFRRTVVLIVEDEEEEGTLGVVLNRPTEVPVGQVLEPWTDLVTGPSVVFRGGPVATTAAWASAASGSTSGSGLARANTMAWSFMVAMSSPVRMPGADTPMNTSRPRSDPRRSPR